MKKDHLKIVAVDSKREENKVSQRGTFIRNRKIEAMAKYERLWKIDPEQFNPLRNCMERERLERTWALLSEHADLSGKLAVDLGCGSGVFSRRLGERGASVHALDIAENALKLLKESDFENIKPIQDYVPRTIQPDYGYDVVVAMELIAELPSDEYRLFFSEIGRLVNRDGFVLCSTPIDYCSEDAIERLGLLAETELEILEWKFSYHALYLRLRNFIEAPTRFVHSWINPHERRKELEHKRSFSRFWFRLNTSYLVGTIWIPIKWLLSPVVKAFNQNKSILLALEKICKFISDRAGVSHAILIGRRRPIVKPNAEPVQERLKKREVWE